MLTQPCLGTLQKLRMHKVEVQHVSEACQMTMLKKGEKRRAIPAQGAKSFTSSFLHLCALDGLPVKGEALGSQNSRSALATGATVSPSSSPGQVLAS